RAISSALRLPPASTLTPNEISMYHTAGSGVCSRPNAMNASTQLMHSCRQSTTASQSKNFHHNLLASLMPSRAKSSTCSVWLLRTSVSMIAALVDHDRSHGEFQHQEHDEQEQRQR